MQELAKRFDESFGDLRGSANSAKKRVTLPAAVLKAEPEFQEQQLTEFYKTYNPTKLQSLRTLLQKYGHNLANLEDVLQQKYGLDTLDCTRSSRLRALARHELEAYYRNRNELQKLEKIDEVLTKYENKDGLAGLIRHIAKRSQANSSDDTQKVHDNTRVTASSTSTQVGSHQEKSTKGRPNTTDGSSAWKRLAGFFGAKPQADKGNVTELVGDVATMVDAEEVQKVGAGFHMKTQAALQRMKWQRRKLNKSFARCDADAAKLQAELM